MNQFNNHPLALAALCVWGVYLFFVSPGLDWFDSPELMQAAWMIDSTHPPGQPLFVMLAKGLSMLPLGSIPLRCNLFSTLTTMLAVAAVFLYPRLRTTAPMIVLAALYLALHPSVSLQAVRTEVYGLHLMLAVLIVVIVQLGNNHDDQRLQFYLPSFLFGLSLSNHHFLTILLAPYLVWYFLRLDSSKKLSICISSVILIGCGLMLYWLIVVRSSTQAPGLISWGNPNSLSRLISFVRGDDFNVFFTWPWEEWKLFLSALRLPGWTALMGLIAVIASAFFNKRQHLSWLLVAGFGLIACSVKTFYVENPDSFGYLAIVSLTLSASGVLTVMSLPKFRSRKQEIAANAAVAVTFLLGVIYHLSVDKIHPIQRSRQALVESYAMDLEAYAPWGSVFFLSSDHALFPLSYRQQVEGVRNDLHYISPKMSDARWYREYLARHYPDLKIAMTPGHIHQQLPADNPGHFVFAEFPEQVANAVPWRHWFGRVPGSASTSYFDNELAQHPKSYYGITGQQIAALIHTTRANYFFKKQELVKAIAEQSLGCYGMAPQFANSPPIKRGQLKPLLIPLVPRTYPVFISDRGVDCLQLALYFFEAAHKPADQTKMIDLAWLAADAAYQYGNINGRLLTANYWLNQSDHAQALQILKTIEEHPPELDVAFGVAHYRAQSLAAAEKYFVKALKKLPNDPASQAYLAKITQAHH